MKKYEIINPSDECYIEGEEFKTVCVATVILGEGLYGLQEVDGELSMPPIVFAKGWFLDTFGVNYGEATKAVDRQHIKTVLSTVKLSAERTSLNDIEKHAKRLVALMDEVDANRQKGKGQRCKLHTMEK